MEPGSLLHLSVRLHGWSLRLGEGLGLSCLVRLLVLGRGSAVCEAGCGRRFDLRVRLVLEEPISVHWLWVVRLATLEILGVRSRGAKVLW